jgi:3-methyladenine DNA glycosylase AlkD
MTTKLSLSNFQKEIRKLADPERAKFSAYYFKTGKGQYAEGDVFLGGISTPVAKSFSKKYQDISIPDLKILLSSKYHEERSVAIGILLLKFAKSKGVERKDLYNFYLDNTEHINNWDLIDVSADKIIGLYIIENPKEIAVLSKLVKSKSLWERRISIMTTFAFIKIGKFEKTFEIAEKLLNDKEDLIHKAVGWMIREVGKRNMAEEERFLKKHYKNMPRTMLRYAIEKFPEELRKKYLLGKI